MLKLPHWATDPSVPLSERRIRACEFVLRYIAAHHNQQGNFAILAKDAGITHQALYAARLRGCLTPSVCKLLANLKETPLTQHEIMVLAGRDSIATLTHADLTNAG